MKEIMKVAHRWLRYKKTSINLVFRTEDNVIMNNRLFQFAHFFWHIGFFVLHIVIFILFVLGLLLYSYKCQVLPLYSKRREVFCLFFFPASMFSCCCSGTKSCPTPCDPIDCSRPDFPVLHYLLEFAQTHVHWVCDAIQPSHPLSPSSPALNLSQHQGLFQ